VAHGSASFSHLANLPFRLSGILEKTGTPVDRTVIVSLRAIEAIHVDWQTGAQVSGPPTPADDLRAMALTPTAITAAFVGTKSHLQVFGLQRAINEEPSEPLLAILPGLALAELWQIVGVAATALTAVSVMVIVSALLGMAAMILSGLAERRREMAILRATGARPRVILGLLVTEAVIMAGLGVLLGLAGLYAGLVIAQPYVDARFGLFLPITPPGWSELRVLMWVVAAGACVSVLPAWRAYRMSLADGMSVRM